MEIENFKNQPPDDLLLRSFPIPRSLSFLIFLWREVFDLYTGEISVCVENWFHECRLCLSEYRLVEQLYDYGYWLSSDWLITIPQSPIESNPGELFPSPIFFPVSTRFYLLLNSSYITMLYGCCGIRLLLLFIGTFEWVILDELSLVFVSWFIIANLFHVGLFLMLIQNFILNCFKLVAPVGDILMNFLDDIGAFCFMGCTDISIIDYGFAELFGVCFGRRYRQSDRTLICVWFLYLLDINSGFGIRFSFGSWVFLCCKLPFLLMISLENINIPIRVLVETWFSFGLVCLVNVFPGLCMSFLRYCKLGLCCTSHHIFGWTRNYVQISVYSSYRAPRRDFPFCCILGVLCSDCRNLVCVRSSDSIMEWCFLMLIFLIFGYVFFGMIKSSSVVSPSSLNYTAYFVCWLVLWCIIGSFIGIVVYLLIYYLLYKPEFWFYCKFHRSFWMLVVSMRTLAYMIASLGSFLLFDQDMRILPLILRLSCWKNFTLYCYYDIYVFFRHNLIQSRFCCKSPSTLPEPLIQVSFLRLYLRRIHAYIEKLLMICS